MKIAIGETWENDGPDGTCFGCGHANERGLRMSFTRTGENRVECRYEAPEHLCGAPNVVHGGVQATLLDEVLGVAGHVAFEDEEVDIVTVDFELRYSRPVLAGVPIVVIGEFERREARDVYVRGEIRDAEGQVLTTARARWRQIAPRS